MPITSKYLVVGVATLVMLMPPGFAAEAPLGVEGAHSACEAGSSSCNARRALLQQDVSIMMNQELNVEEETKLESGACKPWCVKENCNWANCKDCSICTSDTSSTPAPPPPPCKPWCVKDNCQWANCKGCSICDTSSTPAPPPPCKPWCVKENCQWTNCKGCSICAGDAPTTPAVPVPPPAPQLESSTCTPPKGKPNILWLMADDMNYAGGGPGAKMPNLDKLGASGAVFTAAYGDHPICAPSRASIMSGIRGGVSGYYMGRWGNYEAALSDAYKWWDNPVLNYSMEIPEFFRSKCYYVAGTGKVNHDEKPNAGCADCLWDEFYAQTDYGPYANDGTRDTYHEELPDALAQISSAIDYGWARLSHVPYKDKNGGWKYAGGKKMGGPRGMFRFNSVDDRDPTSDEYNAAWAIQKIQEWEQSKPQDPWLLMVGFVKPHTPLHCPDEHFDSFPLEEVVLPEGWDEDASDTFYEAAVTPYNNGFKLAHALKDSYPGGFKEGLRHWMQAYYACVEFVDKQVGKVVDALEASSFSSNTIIVFMADNGWQNGAKQYVYKNSPWEEAAKVPLIIKAPGVSPPGTIVDKPVQLTDVYPTLMELCGYLGENTMKDTEKGHPLTGTSMKPLLEGGSWQKDAAYSQIYPIETKVVLPWPDCNGIQECNHWAMRYDDKDGNKWRYIIYNNGEEELYNQINDPYEQINIANVDATKAAELKQKLINDIGMDENKVGIYDHNIKRTCNTWCAANTRPWPTKCGAAYTACNTCPHCNWKAYNP